MLDIPTYSLILSSWPIWCVYIIITHSFLYIDVQYPLIYALWAEISLHVHQHLWYIHVHRLQIQVPLYTTTIDIEIHANLISKYIHDMTWAEPLLIPSTKNNWYMNYIWHVSDSFSFCNMLRLSSTWVLQWAVHDWFMSKSSANK